jgi:hypothetical protein
MNLTSSNLQMIHRILIGKVLMIFKLGRNTFSSFPLHSVSVRIFDAVFQEGRWMLGDYVID